MNQLEVAQLKIKCLEIAQNISHPDEVQAKAKELFEWVVQLHSFV